MRELEPGALLRCEIAVLDDLTRAPAEALGPLLRILAERFAAGGRVPLETAVATSIPPELDAYADPLEPNQLDRFAIQLRMHGLIQSRDWPMARALLAHGEAPRAASPLAAEERAELRAAATRLPLDADVEDSLLALVRRLAQASGTEGALLSDRTFARAAPAVLRAHALLRGAPRVERADLVALRFLLGRRVPEEVQAAFPSLLSELLPRAEPHAAPASGAAAGVYEGARIAGARAGAAAARTALRDQPLAAPGGEVRLLPPAEVGALLAALQGHIERGRAQRRENPGGTPRRYRRLRGLDEIHDADPLEAVLFAGGWLPERVRP